MPLNIGRRPQPTPEQPVEIPQVTETPVTQTVETSRPKISLSKGQKVSLSKNITQGKAFVGLGWNLNRYDTGGDFDLDASVFLLGENRKVNNESDVVFYNNTVGRNECVKHSGDNRTGEGEGFDEVIEIDFSKIPADISRIAISVTIFDAENRRQNFGQVENSFIRVAKMENDKPVFDDDTISFELGEDFSIETAIVVAEIYRYKGDWKFSAIGAGYQGGLKNIMANYGIDAE